MLTLSVVIIFFLTVFGPFILDFTVDFTAMVYLLWKLNIVDSKDIKGPVQGFYLYFSSLRP